MSHWVYVVRCGDGSLYTGYSTDVSRRLAQHAAGRGARYTRGRGPLELVAAWPYPDKGSALRAELAFKRLPRARKLQRLQQGADAPTAGLG